MIHNHEVPGSIPGPATEEQGTASRSSLFFVTFHDPQKGTDSLFLSTLRLFRTQRRRVFMPTDDTDYTDYTDYLFRTQRHRGAEV